MSQPAKTRSSKLASGKNSLIFGDRPSVRFPSRMVPTWVKEPMGSAMPLRTASTPATKVVATAPMPGIITPNLPFASATEGEDRLGSTSDVRFEEGTRKYLLCSSYMGDTTTRGVSTQKR